MNNALYFPSLKRQEVEKYYKEEGVFYATYNCAPNRENISKDCQDRCVYCDAHVDECGGEPFSIDHFRPLNIFGEMFNGILKIHPFNLHLSCQKCNVLKTNDWKGCLTTENGQTFIRRQGYVDRFQVDIKNYLKVDNDGRLKCIDSNGPAEYMIGKLLLNRTNRVYIRKAREVKYKAQRIQSILLEKQKTLMNDWDDKKFTNYEFKDKMREVIDLLTRFEKLGLIKI